MEENRSLEAEGAYKELIRRFVSYVAKKKIGPTGTDFEAPCFVREV
jgi:uncharacterized protein YaaR (DUF327 family)